MQHSNSSWRSRLIAWGPVVLLMLAIFFASAQAKYAAPDDRTDRFYMSGLMPVFAGQWEFVVKKSAHMLSYAALSALILRAAWRSGVSLREASLVAIVVAMAYSLTDELHQAYVPGRNSSVFDLGFDYVGAASAALAMRWWFARATHRAPESTRAPHQERASSAHTETAPKRASCYRSR